jgi:group I intron endonuclease
MIGFVYRWINLSNNMYYIGSHKGSPDDGYIGSGIYFKRAYKKSPNNFVRDILYQGKDFRELEEFILKTLNAKKDKLSYNLKNTSIGGNTRSGHKNSPEHIRKVANANKGKKMSESQKEKLRLANLGKRHSIESRIKMSKSRTGFKNHFYGKSHTDDSKKKISQSKLGFYIGDHKMQEIWDGNKKKVYCAYLDKTFDSMKQCAKALNLSESSISNMIANRVKNRYGILKVNN